MKVYVMFLDDYENAIGNEGDGEDGDNEGGNLDEGDKVDGVVSEEDSAHKVILDAVKVTTMICLHSILAVVK